MAPVYKIALIQMHPRPLDPEANHITACTYIRSAAAQGAHLAVLPEYHLTSWAPTSPLFRAQCAQSPHYLAAYQRLAAELHIAIVPGTLVTPSPMPSSTTTSSSSSSSSSSATSLPPLLNIAHYISPTGTLLSSYTKINLWHPERPHLSRSSNPSSSPGPATSPPHLPPHRAFDTEIGRVGMLVCWDLAFPEAFRELVADGAKVVIVPTFWTLRDCSPEGLGWNEGAERVFLESVVVARACENGVAVVFVNVGGPRREGEDGKVGEPREGEREASGGYAGLSQVAVPFKGAMGKMGAGEGMSVVEVDMQILEDAEENYKVRADMESEEWHYAHTLRGEGKSRL